MPDVAVTINLDQNLLICASIILFIEKGCAPSKTPQSSQQTVIVQTVESSV